MELIKFIQSFSNPFLDAFFQLVTMMGEDTFFFLIMTLFFWCVNKEMGYKLGFAYITNVMLNVYLKEIIRIPRPVGEPGIRSLRLETAQGFSFPSGHVQRATSLFTSMMLYCRRKWFTIVGSIMIFLVLVSRLYLGVHRLIDCIAGIIIGVIWVLVVNRIMTHMFESGKKNILYLFAIPAIIGMFIFRTESFYKTAGVLISFIMGYMIESTYIHYNPQGKLWQQLIKYLFGINMLILLKFRLIDLLPVSLMGTFLTYFILGLWVIVIAPWFFQWVFRIEN